MRGVGARPRADPGRLLRRGLVRPRRRSTSTGGSSTAMRGRDEERARCGPRRALPDARDAVREGRSAAAGATSSAPCAPGTRRRSDAGATRNERRHRARLRLEDDPRRRRRGPRRRPGAGIGRSQRHDDPVDVVQHGEPHACAARRATRQRAAAGPRGVDRAPGATRSRPPSNDASGATRQPDPARGTCRASQFATSTNAARPAPSTSSASGKRPRLAGRSAERLAREGGVARPPAVGAAPAAVDPPARARRRADPRVEREPPAVDAARAEIASRRAPRGEPGGRDRVATEPERARQHARAATRGGTRAVPRRVTPFSTSLYVPSPERT